MVILLYFFVDCYIIMLCIVVYYTSTIDTIYTTRRSVYNYSIYAYTATCYSVHVLNMIFHVYNNYNLAS